LSEVETAAKQKDLDDSLWAYGRNNIKNYLKTSNKSNIADYVKANVLVFAAPAFFALLSIVCCVFQLIWILTFSYCRPNDPNKGCCRSKCCQKTACWSTIILPFFVFTFTIGWIVQMGKLINSLDDTKCGVTSILNDISNGVNYLSSNGTNTQYSGMKGYSYAFEQFLGNFANTLADVNANSIMTADFNAQATTMYDSLATYHTTYSLSTVKSPSDGTTDITPDSITNMDSTISPAIGTEYTTLKSYSTDVNTMATFVQAASNGNASGTATYTALKSGVNSAIDLFDSLYNTIDKMGISTGAMTDHKEVMKFVTYGIGIGAIALTVWFWISLIFTHKLHKCKCCCECFGKIA